MGSYNKHESKYANTARLMQQALLGLLSEKEFDYITVSEVCKRAGVNRSTFYLHYQGMYELLSETLEQNMQAFFRRFSENNMDTVDLETPDKEQLIFIRPAYLSLYLNYIKENKKLYSVSMKYPELFQIDKITEQTYHRIIFPVLDRFRVKKEEQKYVAAYYIGGIQAIVRAWIMDDCRADVEDMAALIAGIILQS